MHRNTLGTISTGPNSITSVLPCLSQFFNQFTEVFSVRKLAEQVRQAGTHLGLHVRVDHIPNPRAENEEHYYNPKVTKLHELGLKPRLLNEILIEEMLLEVMKAKGQVDEQQLYPQIKWKEQ